MYHGIGSATVGIGGIGGISTLAFTGSDPEAMLYSISGAVVLIFAGLALRKIARRPRRGQ